MSRGPNLFIEPESIAGAVQVVVRERKRVRKKESLLDATILSYFETHKASDIPELPVGAGLAQNQSVKIRAMIEGGQSLRMHPVFQSIAESDRSYDALSDKALALAYNQISLIVEDQLEESDEPASKRQKVEDENAKVLGGRRRPWAMTRLQCKRGYLDACRARANSSGEFYALDDSTEEGNAQEGNAQNKSFAHSVRY